MPADVCISPQIEHRLFSHITMNWRGRPLTSHEVVVKTIAATRTRTGLRVHAELDTADYPIGVSVSKARMDALPIRPHPARGTWNYTIDPPSQPPDGPQAGDHTQARSAALQLLACPALTGMTAGQLDDLTSKLAPFQAAQAEQRYYQQRGGPRRQVAGNHGRPLLTSTDRVLITVIYLRQACSQKVLSEMLEVNPTSIGKAIAETRQLLDEQRCTIEATTLRFTTVQALTSYLTAEPRKPPNPAFPGPGRCPTRP